MKSFLFFLFGLVFYVSATHVHFKDCGSTKGKISTIDVEPCPSLPCQIKKGTDVSFAVKFTTIEPVQNATSVVHGIIAGISEPFNTPYTNACEACGIHCPLVPGKPYTYKAKLPVAKTYPSVDVIAEWELKDDNNRVIWCFEIPISITD